MTFSQKFDSYVCLGDKITCAVDGYTVTARITRDETPDAPDQRQDGFWPSLYPDDAGFIGAGNGWRDRFDAAQARAGCYPKLSPRQKRSERGNARYCAKSRARHDPPI